MKYLIPMIMSALFFAGCSVTNPRYVNAPSVPNTTFFEQKGDMKFSAAGAFSPGTIEKYDYRTESGTTFQREKSSVYGFDGQAAFALTDHFMLAVDGFYRSEFDRFNDDDLNALNNRSEITYERKMINGALGFYGPLGYSRRAYFNFLAGVGVGRVVSDDEGFLNNSQKDFRYHNADLFRVNLHPSFNFFFSDYFRMSLAPRFSFLKYSNINTNYTGAQLTTIQYDALPDHFLPLFEPSLVLQAGFPGANWLKLDMGFNFSSNPDIGAYNLNSRSFMLSFGLSIYPFAPRPYYR